MSYPRPNIQRLEPYTPGEQPQVGVGQRVVKLNTNENPYPPAPAVLEAIRAVTADSLRRYPPPDAPAFRRAAAEVHGVTPEMVIATNGGDELLRLAVTVFCNPGSEGLGVTEPTYSLYPTLAAIHDTPVTRVPLNDDWSLPDDAAARFAAAGCRLVILVNPHAPSGALRPLGQLEVTARALMGRAVLLVDEAYVDFAERDALALLRPQARLDNVLILRTLSKGYSLAGIRFGYGLASPGVAAALNKARDSYPTDVVAQAAALAALQCRAEARQSWAAVKRERERVTHALSQRGWQVPPSQSNFLLATPPAARGLTLPAATIYQTLKQQHIFVRYFDQDRLRDKLRITIGTPEQNDTLLAALDALDPQSKIKNQKSKIETPHA